MIEFIKIFIKKLFPSKKIDQIEEKDQSLVEDLLKEIRPTLKNGAKGKHVIFLKERLAVHGVRTLTLGNQNFLKATENAVKDFQRMKGLTVDGIVGPKTWAKLESEPDVKDAYMTTLQLADAIVETAEQEVGVKEVGGNNRGERVEEYQRATDGKAQSEAWCLAFCQWVTLQVSRLLLIKNPLYATEHCWTLWNKTPNKYKLEGPKRGALAIWVTKTANKYNGHVAICKGGLISGSTFKTVEGNTDADGTSEGDGVYNKTRSMSGTKTLRVVGFIDLPQMLYDEQK